jgi:multiple sugar transport system permease protein
MSERPRIWRSLIATIVALAFVLPLFWAFVISLRPVGTPPPAGIVWWPKEARWDNYEALFELLPMWRYLLNSLLVVAAAIPLTLLTASMAGFSMAQLGPRGQRRMLVFSVAVLMVPGASVWLARFQILRWLGLLDSLWALIVPAFAASTPLFVLLYYWNYRRVPGELFEAARLDGASLPTAWWRLALPMAKPTSVGIVILAFVLYWSDFISPVLYVFDPRWYTLPVGLQILKQYDATAWPWLMAGAVLITLPVLVLFALLQKAFLNDLSLASLFERNS